MERIIINEVDNTSNVEALSSYDVAYVPGFALGPTVEGGGTATVINESLYRVPTLCRDKYEFIKLFGSTCPTFKTTQPYPDSFPEKAIKWGDAAASYYKVQVNNFENVDDIQDSGWYTRIFEMPSEDSSVIRQYYLAQYDIEDGMYGLTAIGGTLTTAYLNENDNLTKAFGKSYFTATFTEVEPEASAEGPDDTYDGEYEAAGDITEFEEDRTYYTRSGEEGSYVYTEASTFDESETYYVYKFGPHETYYIKTVDDPATYVPVDFYKSDSTYYTADDLLPATITAFEPETTYYEYRPFVPAFIEVDTTVETQPVIAEADVYAFTSTIVPANVWFADEEGTAITGDDALFINPNYDSYYAYLADGVQPMFNGPSDKGPGDADPGYRYALTLLSLGMPVYYEQMNQTEDDITVSKMYAGLNARFIDDPSSEDYSFDSMGDYNVKFITSGGYPTFEYNDNGLAEAMCTMANTRKDSIALIDHTDNPSRDLTTYDDNSVIRTVRAWNLNEKFGTFGAMFTPWYECTHPAVVSPLGDSTTLFNNTMMPASLAYLTALSVQLQNYNPWLAVSGVVRGLVPFCKGLHTDKPLTNHIADTYQALPNDGGGTPISINPITYIRNYGYCIWGNRTLRNNQSGTKASSFLNIRSMVSDIKKRLYEASQQTLFEQNTDITWLNYKSLILPLLETMVSDYILEDYAVTRLYTNPDTGYPVPQYEIMAVIRIQPINSIEVFDLTIYMENTDNFNITTTESEG